MKTLKTQHRKLENTVRGPLDPGSVCLSVCLLTRSGQDHQPHFTPASWSVLLLRWWFDLGVLWGGLLASPGVRM